jgi:ribosomal-protein-alanine N-acetyltransferase
MSLQDTHQPRAGSGSTDLVMDRMRWWDLDEVQALEGALFAEAPWTPGQFWSELARVPESRWYVVARRDARVVGYAGLFAVVPEADVQTVAVAVEEQGRGTGRALLGALIARANALGAGVLHLEVRADNAAAIGLYVAMGFVADGRRRDYYGRGRDALLMSLRLPGAPAGPAAGADEGGGS